MNLFVELCPIQHITIQFFIDFDAIEAINNVKLYYNYN